MEDDLVNQQNTLRSVKEENLNFSCDLRNTQKAQQNTQAELDNAKLREVLPAGLEGIPKPRHHTPHGGDQDTHVSRLVSHLLESCPI